jgi:hypothetical protein
MPERSLRLVGQRTQLMPRVVRQLHSPVDITPVSDLDDDHRWFRVVNRIKNPIVALAYAVLVLARELLATVGTWLFRESSNSCHEPLTVLQLDGLEFLDRGWLDLKSIVRHGASDPLAPPRSRGWVR